MSVNFNQDTVFISCNGCDQELVKYHKYNLTLKEALEFADSYKEPIFCRTCSEIPVKIPELLN